MLDCAFSIMCDSVPVRAFLSWIHNAYHGVKSCKLYFGEGSHYRCKVRFFVNVELNMHTRIYAYSWPQYIYLLNCVEVSKKGKIHAWDSIHDSRI